MNKLSLKMWAAIMFGISGVCQLLIYILQVFK